MYTKNDKIIIKQGILSNCVSGSNEFLTFTKTGVIKLRKLSSKKKKQLNKVNS